MNRTPVTSSNIASIGYQDGTLEVEFANGRVYQYFDVSPATHVALLTAESVGTYFANHIRGYYETREVEIGLQPVFDRLTDSITAWRDDHRRGVYFDHAQRLYGLGITDTDMLRALLGTLFRAAYDERT